ncbi:MAG: hypothetical protein WC087_01315 [Candidatus Paceibacterota bacterium]
MKNYLNLFLGVLFITSLLISPVSVIAQDIFIEDLTEAELQEIFEGFGNLEDTESSPMEQETVSSCFDFYQFNSVEVNVITNVVSTVPGSTIAFSGNIVNKNNYPIVNGTVYVKIFKNRESTEKNANGQHVVDQFIAVRGVNLQANEQKEINFEWTVPAWSESGEYQLGTFFISNYRYNLLGLSFTDDIVGNVANFRVTTRESGLVYLDKDNVKILDQDYYFAAFPPRLDKNTTADITTQVINTTDESQNVRVTMNVYSWDAIDPSNFIRKEEKVVNVPANSTAPVSFSVNNTEHPVYLAEISLDYKDTKSFLNIRFVRDGVNKLRINFPAVGNYPLTQNTTTDLFACIHNVSEEIVSGTLRLKIVDELGKEIYSKDWEGFVGGDMMGIASQFVPTKKYTNFSIIAELLQDGKVVETDTVKYSCENFNSCEEPEKQSLFTDQIKMIVSGAVVLLILLALIFMRKKSNKGEELNV